MVRTLTQARLRFSTRWPRRDDRSNAVFSMPWSAESESAWSLGDLHFGGSTTKNTIFSGQNRWPLQKHQLRVFRDPLK